MDFRGQQVEGEDSVWMEEQSLFTQCLAFHGFNYVFNFSPKILNGKFQKETIHQSESVPHLFSGMKSNGLSLSYREHDLIL